MNDRSGYMKHTKISPAEEAMMVEFYEQGGVDVSDIAQEFSINVSTVYAVLRRNGVDLGGRRVTLLDEWDDAKLEEFKTDYYDSKLTTNEIAVKHGLTSLSQIYNILRRLGWTPRSYQAEEIESRKLAMDHAIKLYDETNLPIWQICEETGIHQPELHAEVHRRGITLRRLR